MNRRGFCRTCGATDKLSIDHIVEIADGGSDDEANLQVLCRSCNARKSALRRWNGARTK